MKNLNYRNSINISKVGNIRNENGSHVVINLSGPPLEPPKETREERAPRKEPSTESFQHVEKTIICLASISIFVLTAVAALYTAQQSGDGYLLVSLAKVILEFIRNAFLE